MPFANIRDSYFSELITELTNLELDHSSETDDGRPINRDNWNAKYIRASKYSQKNGEQNSKPNYGNYINNLLQQCLTELSFLSIDECQQVLKRLDIISERIEKAWEVWKKHSARFNENEFDDFDFEIDFFYLFNIPMRGGAWMVGDQSLYKSRIFFHDLQDALMFKGGALIWLPFHLRKIYGIDQPAGTQTPAESNQPNPDNVESVPDFDVYIRKDVREKIRQYLINNYNDPSPADCGYLIYALIELEYAQRGTFFNNISALYRSLAKTLNFSGTRQALSKALNRLDEREINDLEKEKINMLMSEISNFIKADA